MLLASDFDKTKYLKAVDLEREKKFRIKAVTADELGIGKDKETKLVVWFTNDDRGLPLNKTNNRTLRGAFGDDTAGWAAKVIAVFPTMVDVRGKMERPCGYASRRRSRLWQRLRQHSRRHQHRPEMVLRQQHRTGGAARRSGARAGSEVHFNGGAG